LIIQKNEQLMDDKINLKLLYAGEVCSSQREKWDILVGKIKVRGFTFSTQKKLNVSQKKMEV